MILSENKNFDLGTTDVLAAANPFALLNRK